VTKSEPQRRSLPLLPLKNTVLFPQLAMPLGVGRAASVAAVEAALASEDKTIAVASQKDGRVDEPGAGDLFHVGTHAVIKKMTRAAGGLQIVAHGLERIRLAEVRQTGGYLEADVVVLPDPGDWDAECEALERSIMEVAGKLLEAGNVQAHAALNQLIAEVEKPLHRMYFLASMLSLDIAKEQALLAADTQIEALRLMHGYLTHEAQVAEVRAKIASDTQSEITREQREHILRRQMEAIQRELGEQSPEQAEVAELRTKLAEADLPEEVRKEAERELSRLERLPAAAPDFQLTRTYVELIAELPWKKSTEDQLDLERARRILDEDHYDLEEIKQRIIEQLAVMKLNPAAKAPILCFVGPPGVGKTSLGHSIARSLGREFARMSLGGLSDEAELRGHRRTYIGAMPGRIIQAIRRAGVHNPLLMLDEVDKLGRDFRGDPAAALLEILDPAQNHEFRDNYLDLPFDLSGVFFIATANTLDTVPQPLLDRMELLRLAGYSDDEKLHIARRYLLPRRLTETGLDAKKVTITNEAVSRVIRRYTREAGVRELERTLGRICRKIATRFAEGHTEPVRVDAGDLTELLGVEKFFAEDARKQLPPGVVAGLAWTQAGGEILYVEAVLLPESKDLVLTGQLGDVMKESARAARSFIGSHADELGIDAKLLHGGVHVHVPAGATPKDGPSAGVTMATALASLFTGHAVRSDTAMTGEITLSGLVLPVGGIKEKLLAAHRAGIRRVILPKRNEQDASELPEHVRKELELVYAESIGDVLGAAIPELAGRLNQAA
jgi:ATP-dependent Lon protease